MLGLAVGIVLLCAAVWFVALPILRPHAEPGPADAGADPEDDLSPRAVALRALSEIEFDRATGKLSQGDYEALKARYTREAVTALRTVESAPGPVLALASKPVPPPAAKSRPSPGPAPTPTPTHSCPVHGVRGEVGAAYCSECGRRLGVQDGDVFCARCGTLLEPEARFCGRCGGRVAA